MGRVQRYKDGGGGGETTTGQSYNTTSWGFTARMAWCYRLKKTCKNKIGAVNLGNRRDGGTERPEGASPAHSLHHVRDEAVRDAWTGLLGQIKGVFQLLDGSYSSSARSPLLLQLQELEHHI